MAGLKRIFRAKHGAMFNKRLNWYTRRCCFNLSSKCVETSFLTFQNRRGLEQPQVQRTSPEDSAHSPLSHDIPGFPGPAGVILLSVPVLLCSTRIKFNDPLTSLYLSLTLSVPPPAILFPPSSPEVTGP